MIYIELRGRNIFCEGLKTMLANIEHVIIEENDNKTADYEKYKTCTPIPFKLCIIDAEYNDYEQMVYTDFKTRYLLFSESFNSRACSNKIKGFLSYSVCEEHLTAGIQAVLKNETYIDPFFAANVIEIKAERGINGASRYKLTTRETEVLQLIIKRENNQRIAQRLGLSENTVKNHVSHILQKMNVKSRNQVLLKLNSPIQQLDNSSSNVYSI